MNRRKKVAVVGVGSLGRHHARIYAESPLADLVAVVDPDEERVNEVAARTGCRPLNDCRRLPDDVEAVSVAVPTVDHVPVALTLLKRGMDVNSGSRLLSARADSGMPA